MEKQYTISTKVSIVAYSFLASLAEKSGITMYKMLQTVVECFLKYFSDDSYLTDSLCKVINSFADFRLTKDSFMFCSHDAKDMWSLDSAIISIKAEDKPQPRSILIHKKEQDGKMCMVQNYNNDVILTCFLQSFAPEILKDLNEIMHKNNTLSLTDALKFAVQEQIDAKEYDLICDIESLFEEDNRTEDNKEIDWDSAGKYARRCSRSIYSQK